ncbi:uncharacterized protein LOC100900535 [Galendromus occidentalis]|uniref:Small ribosomal subunit protein uS15m n=1 Tax=Galendromus occidentalis TaxID=34638 RepID=A0AAJ6VWP1_9ACAR|nr:uncharacterized protein LOC100900535 [Galendromus occidentalis]
MLRSVCAMLRPAVMDTVPRRFRRRPRTILTWPIEYLPFKWTYPQKQSAIEASGDKISGLPPSDGQRPRGAFAKLPELEKAPEAIRRVFSLDFAPKAEINQAATEELLDLVRRHPYDKESLEYKIATKTSRIRLYREAFEKHQRNYKLKGSLNVIVLKRNKLLKMLGRLDQERYNFVKEALQIEHTPFPLGKPHQKITRKGELRRLTQEWADKVKAERMAAFHASLKEQQEAFEKEKKSTLEWIEKEIKELNLTEDELKQLEFKGIFQ